MTGILTTIARRSARAGRWSPTVVAAAVATALGQACARAEVPRDAEWTLTETLRIGGAEEGPASFDYVKGLDADAQGRILVYDRQSQDIRMFGPDGALVRVIGRKGSGPGELRDAEGIAVAPDGRLWVRDAANARFSVFSGDGEPEANWTMQFCSSQGAWTPLADAQGRWVDHDCAVVDGRGEGDLALAYHLDRSRVDTLGAVPECGTRALAEAATWITRTPTSTSYRPIPYAPRAHSALGSRGELWCAPNSATYEVLRLGPGAGDTLRITRTVAPLPVTGAERDSVVAAVEARGPTGVDFSRIPAVKPSIERLTVDERGRLWVRRATGTGAIAFDVFAPDGAFLATASLAGVRTSVWTPFVVRGDHLYVVVLGEDDVAEVVRYRVGGG